MATLRWLLATSEAVIEEFKTSNIRTLVEFLGVFQHSKLPINGTAEVLEIRNKTLIIWYENAICTLSNDLTSDIHTTHIVIPFTISDTTPITQSQTRHFDFRSLESGESTIGCNLFNPPGLYTRH
jgi:hypothetical protein